MLVVVDANVWVSAFISPDGPPATIVRLWREGRLSVVVSREIVDELERVLHYPKLRKQYPLPEESVAAFLLRLRRFARIVMPQEPVFAVAADPTDNRYLECALAAGATILVSGDRHLLALGEYGGVQILTPAGFLAFLRMSGQ